jgi:hypothetical protein
MSDDKLDLAAIDAAMSRVLHALSQGKYDADTRGKLEEELRILKGMRLEIANSRGAALPSGNFAANRLAGTREASHDRTSEAHTDKHDIP